MGRRDKRRASVFPAGENLAAGAIYLPRGCEIIRGPHAAKPHGAMREASKRLEFEYAAVLRDRIIELRGQ